MEIEGKHDSGDAKYPHKDEAAQHDIAAGLFQHSRPGPPLPVFSTASSFFSSSSSSSPSSRHCLSTVSADALGQVLTFLYPHEVAAFLPCSHFTSAFAQSEAVWAGLLHAHFPQPRPPLPSFFPAASSSAALFRQYLAEFPPRYWPYYRAIVGLHARLLVVLRAKAPWIAESLTVGPAEAKVQRLVGAALAPLSQPLPEPWYAWLLFAKLVQQGPFSRQQRSTWWTGLFGTIHYYNTTVNLRLTTLEEAVHFFPAGGLEPPGQRVICAPLTRAHVGEDQVRFLLLSDGRVVRRLGQVVPPAHVVAPSFTAFLSAHVERLESGVYEVRHPQPVQRGVAPGISRFAFPDPCGSDCVTRGIRVQTSVLFVSEACVGGRFFFAYRIRMTHTGDTRVDATLTTRRWLIASADGREEVVEGEGVIGLHPVSALPRSAHRAPDSRAHLSPHRSLSCVCCACGDALVQHLYPGCPPFEYESVCPLTTPTGTMGGRSASHSLPHAHRRYRPQVDD